MGGGGSGRREEKRSRVMKDRITQKDLKSRLKTYCCYMYAKTYTFGFSGYLNYLTIDYKFLTFFPTRRLRNLKKKENCFLYLLSLILKQKIKSNLSFALKLTSMAWQKHSDSIDEIIWKLILSRPTANCELKMTYSVLWLVLNCNFSMWKSCGRGLQSEDLKWGVWLP